MGTRGPCLGMFRLGARANVGRKTCPWSWTNQDLSDEETFARVTHESSDGNDFAVDTLNRADDFCDPQPVFGWLPCTPQSSWKPCTDTSTSGGSYAFRRYVIHWSSKLGTNMRVIVEPPEGPSPSEQAPAQMEGTTSDVDHPVQ